MVDFLPVRKAYGRYLDDLIGAFVLHKFEVEGDIIF